MHFKNGDPEEFNRQIDIVAQNLATYFKKGSKRFAAGDNLTFADFSLFELLDFMNFYSGGQVFENQPVLKQYHQRIVQLPRFSKAWADDNFLRKEPYKYGKMAITKL